MCIRRFLDQQSREVSTENTVSSCSSKQWESADKKTELDWIARRTHEDSAKRNVVQLWNWKINRRCLFTFSAYCRKLVTLSVETINTQTVLYSRCLLNVITFVRSAIYLELSSSSWRWIQPWKHILPLNLTCQGFCASMRTGWLYQVSYRTPPSISLYSWLSSFLRRCNNLVKANLHQ